MLQRFSPMVVAEVLVGCAGPTRSTETSTTAAVATQSSGPVEGVYDQVANALGQQLRGQMRVMADW